MNEAAYEAFMTGMELLESRRSYEALEFLREAKEAYPEKASIREALGRAYFNCRHFADAKEEFEASTEIEPTNHYAHYGLALSSFRLGERDLARKHLRIALAMRDDPKYREALGFLR